MHQTNIWCTGKEKMTEIEKLTYMTLKHTTISAGQVQQIAKCTYLDALTLKAAINMEVQRVAELYRAAADTVPPTVSGGTGGTI